MARDSLVPWHHNMVHKRPLSLQRDLVAACLIDPSQSEVLIVLSPEVLTTMSHCVTRVKSVLTIGLLYRLRVDKSVPEDGLF